MVATGPKDEPTARRGFGRAFEAGWQQLIERAGAGEQQALAALYDQSSRLIYSVVLRIVGNQADAEEVTLDVYTQVWRSARSYTAERSTPSTWLIMMARSRALDRLRSRDSRQNKEAPLDAAFDAQSAEAPPEEAAAMNQMRTRMKTAMEALAPEQREAIELAFYSGLSHSELAAKLGQPLGTVKTRIRLGMIKLRQALGAPEGVQ